MGSLFCLCEPGKHGIFQYFVQAGICFLSSEYSSNGMIYLMCPGHISRGHAGGDKQGGARNGNIKSFSKV